VKDADVPDGGERAMLSFETLTLTPIDRRLIVKALLLPDERRWLDAYHSDVEKTLSPHLQDATRAWLVAACKPL